MTVPYLLSIYHRAGGFRLSYDCWRSDPFPVLLKLVIIIFHESRHIVAFFEIEWYSVVVSICQHSQKGYNKYHLSVELWEGYRHQILTLCYLSHPDEWVINLLLFGISTGADSQMSSLFQICQNQSVCSPIWCRERGSHAMCYDRTPSGGKVWPTR